MRISRSDIAYRGAGMPSTHSFKPTPRRGVAYPSRTNEAIDKSILATPR